MIVTKLSQRFVYEEFKANNEYRIDKYGIRPLCKECINECKLGNAQMLTLFFCADFRRNDGEV